MIDPILSLAFSVHSNKGVYALLIGSGVSRSSGIPTGWEIILDLSRKLAHLKGENCEPDPVAWYRDTFGEDPDYARLIQQIAKSPAERTSLLRSYFEPTEEERQQGLKIPTKAHTAIARLVASGYLRVIVTTNFDRLTESALESAGITPTVISTPDSSEGAPPLTHAGCSIIKVHGDYLDSRIKNSPEELAQYDKRINRLLDRIFDEFGLIVCGWSAEWDVALRNALERCKSYRFTTYWTAREEPTAAPSKLIELRRAHVIHIGDADSFFSELADKVSALDDISRPHPLSARVAVANLKHYIVDGRYKIKLHDLVMNETERVYGELTVRNFPVHGVPFSAEELSRRVRRYEALSEILLSLMINGCYWGNKDHLELWQKSLERIATPAGERSGLTVWLDLKLYPALFLLYGAGIAAISGKHYETFAALLRNTTIREAGKDSPALLSLYTFKVMNSDIGQRLPGMERHYTPVSDHLFQTLREPLRELLQDDIRYEETFDRFEYLSALLHADLHEKESHDIWGPVGRFGWRSGRRHDGGVITEIADEVKASGNNWPVLKTGLFDGSIERFSSIKTAFDAQIAKLGWRW